MRIALERPDQPDVVALIDELDAYQKPLYPPESHHGIDIAALLQPNVLFAVVRVEAVAIGCGAVVLTPEYGEIKRMYLSNAHRGQGIARLLLEFLETQAAILGCRRYALETGIHQLAAIALYERAGYVRCGPFGSYAPDPLSVFMFKGTPVP
jgi:putative acetyltransferase